MKKEIKILLKSFENNKVNQGILSLIASFYIGEKYIEFYNEFFPKTKNYRGIKKFLYFSTIFLFAVIISLLRNYLAYNGEKIIREGVQETKEKYETDEEEKE